MSNSHVKPRRPLDRDASYEDYTRTTLFGSLDGLRALSVIAVIWHHTSGTPGPAVLGQGFLGVEFFFAISGFLITTLLLRERRATGRISLRKFYVRRILRIFPLYYAVLLMYVALTALTRADTPEGHGFFANLPAFATYTSNWFLDFTAESVTFYFAWSLATEEQFYLLWPPLLVVLAAMIPKWQTGPAVGVLIALMAVDQIAEASADGSGLLVRILSSLSLPILLAALAAVLLNEPRTHRAIATVLGRRWSAPVAFAVLLICIASDTPLFLIQVAMVAAVVTVTITERTYLHPVLMWRPLASVGVISYGMYLMHMLAAGAVRVVVDQERSVIVFVGTLLAVLIAASLSFRYFEKPLLRLKRRFEANPAEQESDEIARS